MNERRLKAIVRGLGSLIVLIFGLASLVACVLLIGGMWLYDPLVGAAFTGAIALMLLAAWAVLRIAEWASDE